MNLFGAWLSLVETPRSESGRSMANSMYYVYILRSLKNTRYYIGCTNNLTRRLHEHNSGQTKGNRYYGPFEVVYKETYAAATDARKREYYIKSQKSRIFIENLIKLGVA